MAKRERRREFLAKLAIKCLLRTFVGLDTALGELPGVLPDTPCPQHLAMIIGQDDADIRSKSIGIDHLAARGQLVKWF